MSVRARLDDARVLWANEHREGALLSVLVAVAATSRKRYPHPAHKDRDAFTNFVADELVVITSGGVERVFVRVPGVDTKRWPDEQMPMQDCLYEIIRCNLAHEAILPDNVEFFDARPGVTAIEVRGDRIRLSTSWIDGLSKAVTYAPENADLFPDVAAMPADVVAWMLVGDRRDGLRHYMERRAERARHLRIVSPT